MTEKDWWRSAVTYQIYPRSFADSNNDGTGDIAGMTEKLPYVASLGVDAIWVSPWYPSPLWDGGYDVADYTDIEPDFGTLEEADTFVREAHKLGLRVLIDLVPNHCSIDHPFFQAALKAGPGSKERDLFVFREGRGEDGELPPTNWGGQFGGSAWERVIEADGEPGQWYLHMFAPEQPDWNWDNPVVAEFFDSVLEFWFDRGVDGFRIDVADSMYIDPAYSDVPVDPKTGFGTMQKFEGHPLWDQPALEQLQQRWRALADEYVDTAQGPRVFVSEAYLPIERLVRYVDEGRLHSSFNFEFLESAWTPQSLKTVIDSNLRYHREVGAPTTWVMNNHDVTRTVSRLGKANAGIDFAKPHDDAPDAHWDDAMEAIPTDVELGRRRARAAVLLMLALPGGAYVYQGEELGLDEVEDLPIEVLQDPIWTRSNYTIRGRDGCRVPIPWSGTQAPFGFGVDAEPWLPQPAHWAEFTVEAEDHDPASMLNLYRAALRERKNLAGLGDGALTWDDTTPEVLSFIREPGVRCVVNFGSEPVAIEGDVIVSSQPIENGQLPQDAAVWLKV